jgi:hypothetical protein
MNPAGVFDKAIFSRIQKAGVPYIEAEKLSIRYAGADPDDYAAGLHSICLAFNGQDPKTVKSPKCEPWKSIFELMISDIESNHTDPMVAFSNAVSPFDRERDLQQAITMAVGETSIALQNTQQSRPRGYKTKDFLGTLKQLGYSFRLNSCSDQVEVNGKPITDGLNAKIQTQMADKGFWNATFLDRVILAEAYDNQYHPVKEYLTSLPGHDGGNYIKQLAECFDNPDGLFPNWIRKWMIGAIARVVEGSQNPMLILDGPQNIGKSLFAKWLCSGIPQYFCEGNIDTNDKDSYIRLASKWIWEVGEVGATLRKSDREALKNFLTLGVVTVRKSYGRHDLIKPTLASFIGTVNNEGGLLDDPTGSRRFLICHLNSIDWQTYIDMDINKLWSEAYSAYLTGESWALTIDERNLSEKNNEEYQVEDPIELVLHDHYFIEPARVDWWSSTLEITRVLQEAGIHYPTSKALQMAMAGTLKKIGLKQNRPVISNQKISGWQGIKDKFVP